MISRKLVSVVLMLVLVLAVGGNIASADDGSKLKKEFLKKGTGVSGLMGGRPNNLHSVLYDQTGGASGNGAPSQDFEAAFDVYDSNGADDFTVTDAGWAIDGISVVGSTNGFDASTDLNVWFYTDGGGVPGSLICS